MDLDAGVNQHCIAKMFEFLDKNLVAASEGAERSAAGR
jgi:hypothetical protein